MTRLHSNRMHTARALTVAHSMLCAGGCTWGECLLPGGVCSGGCLLLGLLLGGKGVPGPWWGLLQGGPLGGCTWSWADLVPGGGVCSRGVYLVGGVCSWRGVPGPRGCLFQEVSAPRGELVLGGICSGGCTWSGVAGPLGGLLLGAGVPCPGGSAPGPGGVCTWSWGGTCPGTPPPTVNRILHTRLWKYYLAPNFVCGR